MFVQRMAEPLDYHVQIKRINKRQTYRDNSTANDDGCILNPEQ